MLLVSILALTADILDADYSPSHIKLQKLKLMEYQLLKFKFAA